MTEVRMITALGLLLLCPIVASAQYRREAGDTIRLREVTTGVVHLATPGGAIELHSEHDATIAVAFGRGDSAQAWYEHLRIALVSPQGRQEPVTTEVLGRPFTLTFDSRGRVQMRRAPSFPAAFEGVSDLSHQFDDLFPRLPDGPLAVGLVWHDTVRVDSTGADGAIRQIEHQIRSRVLRDTLVAGEAAWLIESVQSVSSLSVQRIKDQPLTARTRLSGADSGMFVFSRDHGRLLARQRGGELHGDITYEGGPQPIVLPMHHRYQNAVTRVP